MLHTMLNTVYCLIISRFGVYVTSCCFVSSITIIAVVARLLEVIESCVGCYDNNIFLEESDVIKLLLENLYQQPPKPRDNDSNKSLSS